MAGTRGTEPAVNGAEKRKEIKVMARAGECGSGREKVMNRLCGGEFGISVVNYNIITEKC